MPFAGENICHIAGAGDFFGLPRPRGPGDFLIAADAGYEHLAAAGARPDLVVGDFDSMVEPEDFENILRLPVKKDETDMAAAIRAGRERGYRTFFLLGGAGGRLDHTLANLQCVCGLAGEGLRAYLFGGDFFACGLSRGSLKFAPGARGIVSVFAHSDRAEGVWLRGLQYPLENARLENGFPLGVSNAFSGAEAEISVRDGTLLVYAELPAFEKIIFHENRPGRGR